MGFKMRSGNKPTFKTMGSSPYEKAAGVEGGVGEGGTGTEAPRTRKSIRDRIRERIDRKRAERANQTTSKTHRLLGRTWEKTKQFDEEGRKIGKHTVVRDRYGKEIGRGGRGTLKEYDGRPTEGGESTTTQTTSAGGGEQTSQSVNMADLPLQSDERRAEYDRRGWAYDDTIAGYNRDGTKIVDDEETDTDERIVVDNVQGLINTDPDALIEK